MRPIIASYVRPAVYSATNFFGREPNPGEFASVISSENTGFAVGCKSGQWAHLLEAAAISASENEVTTAEAYDLGWKSERQITDHDFLFGRPQWRKDNFSAFDTQFSQTLGYGRRLIDNDIHKLNLELGVGARQSELQHGGLDENETIVTAGGLLHVQEQL